MSFIPGCGHCKRMKEDYLKAAAELKAEGHDCQVAMFDCSENPEMTEKFEISGFPTVKLFKKGKYIKDYNGKRTKDDLMTFVKTNTVKDEL